MGARVVRIDAIRVVNYEWPFADVEVECGKGTYIRSIARDLGAILGCRGLVQTLRRTRVGPFTTEQGVSLDIDPANVKLLPVSLATTGMPRLQLSEGESRRLTNGQPLKVGEPWCRMSPNQPIAVVNAGGELIAIARPHNGGTLRPDVVLGR